jgi:tRNA(His) 5'-end guanylyltransferase
MDKLDIGSRMKMYEEKSRVYLKRKTPVIIRLDGCHFHTFTKGFDKPFDKIIETCMTNTMLYLCKNIQGCVLGYTQSDEITLVLCDYQKPDTDAWFKNNTQKMTSVSASIATYAFMKYLEDEYYSFLSTDHTEDTTKRRTLLLKKMDQGAFFDSRAFSIPVEEVENCLIWRQLDARRNSVQALAQYVLGHKQCQNLSCEELKKKLLVEKDVNWNTDLSTYQKSGSCAIRNEEGTWFIDTETPDFISNRDYIRSRIVFN